MSWIESGSFRLGASAERMAKELALCEPAHVGPCREQLTREQPARVVELPGFWIDRHEVTVSDYAKCVGQGLCAAVDYERCETLGLVPGGRIPVEHALRATNHPIVCVSFKQAEQFCRWKGARLPTEAEWERAAKGTRDSIFPWGDEWRADALNWGENGAPGSIDGFVFTSPVGTFPTGASAAGVYDMAGNVWEWTSDRYALYGAATSPSGAPDARYVTRGGGFAANRIAFTTTHRAPQPPDRITVNIGFRCAASEGGPHR